MRTYVIFTSILIRSYSTFKEARCRCAGGMRHIRRNEDPLRTDPRDRPGCWCWWLSIFATRSRSEECSGASVISLSSSFGRLRCSKSREVNWSDRSTFTKAWSKIYTIVSTTRASSSCMPRGILSSRRVRIVPRRGDDERRSRALDWLSIGASH